MQRSNRVFALRRCLSVWLCLAAASAAMGDTTVPISGIGTAYNPPAFTIDTRVDQVIYGTPVAKVHHGIPVIEIRGTVSGTGWGGTGWVNTVLAVRAANAHYRYDIPFVARWRQSGRCDRLVFFNHGGGPNMPAAVQAERNVGPTNNFRSAELAGDLLVGVPALLDGATYISINRRGLRGDGTFSATYLPPVDPLTQMELDSLNMQFGNFAHPGLTAGAPVPALPTNDAATVRDVARALEQVMVGFHGRPFRARIAVGTSSGARLLAALDFGVSLVGSASVRTGGNYVEPYNKNSRRIFDGFILNGFPYAPNVPQSDAEFPISAPTMFLQGQGDERYQQHMSMVHELLQKGVALNGLVWIYEVKNVPHVSRDVVTETKNGPDGDRLGCFISAAIRNLRCRIEQGTPPPLSRMAGRIINDALRFDQAGGTTTNIAPVLNDPAIDVAVVDQMLTLRTIGPAETHRWREVTAALPHINDAITPPTVACRLGGYKLKFFGAELVPFTAMELRARHGSFAGYRAGICGVVSDLVSQRLYDARVESAYETAERARVLFTL